MSVDSWMVLHKDSLEFNTAGGCYEQSQLYSVPQETSAGDGWREQTVP